MRQRHYVRRLAAILLTGVAFAAPAHAIAQNSAAVARSLRVCADPDDLPFSGAKPEPSGLYVELGQLIAQDLGRTFEPVWVLSNFGKRAVRTTLLAKTCDAYIGLPGVKGFMGPAVIYSKPFMHLSYAIMAAAGQPITGLDDLAGKRVAVQFSTPPQTLLANRDDVQSVTFLNPEDAAQALGRHDVDAAFIWGPTAGYINQTVFHGLFRVTPVAGDDMRYPVKIGFARVDEDLRDQIDLALDANHTAIANLAVKYGLPTAAPVILASLPDAPSSPITLATTTEPGAAQSPAPRAADVAATVAAPDDALDPAMVAAGHELFNGTCAHCHGPDAVQSVRKIDLRLLRHRYGDDAQAMFHETVTHGRPAKGMPNWNGIFTKDEFNKIFAYLSSVQTQ